MTRRCLKNPQGFSLIEVILVLTISSVVFAMMFSFFGTTILDSSQPVIQLGKSLALNQTAEKITARYRQDSTADLNLLKTSLNTTPSLYGLDYSVLFNEFIKFVSGNDTLIAGGDPETLLKVKIRQDQTHETITLLFRQE